ncbi:MAG: sulfite exporter TauE/SafE family protein [Candidatus Hydrothermales bacterium]
MIQNVVLLFIGIFAGILSGLFGIGGGLIIIPSLVLIFKMNQHLAQGISLGSLLLPVGILGFLEYMRNNNVNLKASLIIALGLFVGTYFGAFIANLIPTKKLSKLFAIFLMFVAVRLFFLK